ncbi:hypothetical protein [Trichlorobacter lovleyi]|uniref:hypothetical protein n=1 Tax=Trichlorobacter lovleyi TaxID=313985 RepID=UPI002480689F|nr:hypothetical protein [Trichlorobacter lovleyi]
MRRDEEAVAQALVDFLGGPAVVSASDGDDPPDLYLSFATSRIGVEVTRLSQFTFEQDGRLGNRATQDSFGLRLIERLNAEIGPSLPDSTSLLVGLWGPVKNALRFEKGVTIFAKQISNTPKMGTHEEREIEGSKASITVIPLRPSEKKIVGYVVNMNSSPDIGLNSRLILEDRIRTKSNICEKLQKPIWLALLNDYWLADADSYERAAIELKIAHCFQRLFIVSTTGTVTELTAKA